MSYNPEDPPIGDDGIDESTEDTELRTLAERFEDIIDAFFDANPDIDWFMIGDTTETIVDSGRDSALLTTAQVDHLSEVLGERLHVFGKPITLEPTSPDPTAPSAR